MSQAIEYKIVTLMYQQGLDRLNEVLVEMGREKWTLRAVEPTPCGSARNLYFSRGIKNKDGR